MDISDSYSPFFPHLGYATSERCVVRVSKNDLRRAVGLFLRAKYF